MKSADEMSEDELNEWFRNVESVAQEHSMSLGEYFASLPKQLERLIERNRRDHEIAVALKEAGPNRERAIAVLETLTADERSRLLQAINKALDK